MVIVNLFCIGGVALSSVFTRDFVTTNSFELPKKFHYCSVLRYPFWILWWPLHKFKWNQKVTPFIMNIRNFCNVKFKHIACSHISNIFIGFYPWSICKKKCFSYVRRRITLGIRIFKYILVLHIIHINTCHSISVMLNVRWNNVRIKTTFYTHCVWSNFIEGQINLLASYFVLIWLHKPYNYNDECVNLIARQKKKPINDLESCIKYYVKYQTVGWSICYNGILRVVICILKA